MKKFLFSLCFLFVVVPVAYAQDGIPNQLVELIQSLGAIGTSLIVGFTSTLSSGLTNWIRHLSFFSEADKSKISGLAADLVNVLSSLLVALLMIGVSYAVGLVNDLSVQDLLQALTALTAMTAGGSSVVVHKLNKALVKSG